MIKTHGLTHLSLAVRDPDCSLAFYQKVFGVKEYYRDENSIQVLGLLHTCRIPTVMRLKSGTSRLLL